MTAQKSCISYDSAMLQRFCIDSLTQQSEIIKTIQVITGTTYDVTSSLSISGVTLRPNFTKQIGFFQSHPSSQRIYWSYEL